MVTNLINATMMLADHMSLQAMMLLANGGDAANEGEAPSMIQKLLQGPAILIIGLLAIWYITMILPERRRRAEEDRLMSALKKNDRVVTIGGIHGTIVDVSQPDVVTVRIDESGKTRVKISRSAIAKVQSNKQEKKETTESADKDSK